jgi:hypothetical protein
MFRSHVLIGSVALAALWIAVPTVDAGSWQTGSPDPHLHPSHAVVLCHIPPDEPASAHTIKVGHGGVPAHLAHGDTLGACPDDGVGDCTGPPAPVAQTGQTDCFNAGSTEHAVDCSGTGQDGEHQTGVFVGQRFTDNGDGTVSDNLTGLIWLQNASCWGVPCCPGVPQMDELLWSWGGALYKANHLGEGSCGLADGSAPGDWRLPSIKELQSLIDYGHSDPALPEGDTFSGVQSACYWSSTSVETPCPDCADDEPGRVVPGGGDPTPPPPPGHAWFVHLPDGSVAQGLKGQVLGEERCPDGNWDDCYPGPYGIDGAPCVAWPVRDGS